VEVRCEIVTVFLQYFVATLVVKKLVPAYLKYRLRKRCEEGEVSDNVFVELLVDTVIVWVVPVVGIAVRIAPRITASVGGHDRYGKDRSEENCDGAQRHSAYKHRT
jgi:hypothetical protein